MKRELVAVTELMSAPEGMAQVGDEFHPIGALERPPVVGVCEHCGHDLRDTEHNWSEVAGHVCDGEYREHPNGEGIRYPTTEKAP